MGKLIQQLIIVLIATTLILMPIASVSANEDTVTDGSITIDALVARPLGITATIAGTTLFVISLPFAALGGNVKESFEKTMVKPAKYTFVRPIGDFSNNE